MNIFFDVDYTIVALDGKLRPGVKELFQRLAEEGHDIYVWSGMGIRRDTVRYKGLEPWVKDVFEKPLWDYAQRLKAHGVPIRPDFVVDDYPEVVAAFGGFTVKPFIRNNEDDREMERVYEAIVLHLQDGHRPPP